jgi:predicted DNA-binding transcriptional regulator AlpA
MSDTTSIANAAKRIGISRSGIYRLINGGHLRTKKIYQRQVILTASIDAFLADPSPVTEEKAA